MRQEALWVIVIAAIASNISALAQVAREQTDPNQRQVYLVRKDQADCTNSDVPNVDSPLVGVECAQVGKTRLAWIAHAPPSVRSRISAAPLRCRSRCIASGTPDRADTSG
jgi:hypothetical protein